jgi:hypothetical protein
MTAIAATPALVLEEWLPKPEICTHHRRSAAATPEVLWSAAREVRLNETRTLGRLVRWRVPGVPKDQSFLELFREPPFAVLAEGDRWSVSGLCGRIWTLERDYAPLGGPGDFHAWAVPGTARVLFAHWVQPEYGRSTLHSEVRVQAIDRRASVRLRGLWALVNLFERRIGSEPLALAARRAEGRSAGARTATTSS